MIRGLYTAASGMNAEELRQDVIADNLANVSTTGFKKDEAVFQACPDQMIQRIHDRMDEAASKQASAFGSQAAVPLGKLGQGVMPDATVTNFSDGSVIRTDRPLDLALHGNALFTVQRGDGSTAYTRAGNFTLNTDQDLVTEAGELVMSTGGQPISVDGAQVTVSVGRPGAGGRQGRAASCNWRPTTPPTCRRSAAAFTSAKRTPWKAWATSPRWTPACSKACWSRPTCRWSRRWST